MNSRVLVALVAGLVVTGACTDADPATSAVATSVTSEAAPATPGRAETADDLAGTVTTLTRGEAFPKPPAGACDTEATTRLSRYDAAANVVVWSTEGPYVDTHRPIVGESFAWMVGARQYASQIGAIDLATGDPAWLWTSREPITAAQVVDDTMVVLTRGGLVGLDAATGRHRWSYRGRPGRQQLVQQTEPWWRVRVDTPRSGPDVYLNDDGNAIAVRVADGAVAWVHESTAHDFSFAPVVVAEGVIQIDFLAAITLLDATSGEERWRWIAPERAAVDGVVAVGDDVVIARTIGYHDESGDPPDTGAERLIALRLDDGTELWSRRLDERDQLLDVGGLAVLVRERDGTVHVLDPNSNASIGHPFPDSSPGRIMPSLDLLPEHLIVSSPIQADPDGRPNFLVRSIDPVSEATQWQRPPDVLGAATAMVGWRPVTGGGDLVGILHPGNGDTLAVSSIVGPVAAIHAIDDDSAVVVSGFVAGDTHC